MHLRVSIKEALFLCRIVTFTSGGDWYNEGKRRLVPRMMMFPAIIIWMIGFAILYFVIETAVKNGINKSILGQVEKEKGSEGSIKE